MKIGKRIIKVLVILAIGMVFGTSVVAADYIGPQRTYQIDVPSSCHYTYSGSGDACAGYPSNPVSCTCNIYCDSCLRSDLSCSGVSPGQVDSQCGNHGFSQTDFELVYRTVTRSYPIAVAGTNWSCPIPGINGWCYSPFPVQLYGVDNYADHGYQITALEGLLDGVPFFADAVDTITIEIGEGSHHLDFWALSSYGDSSNHFVENYYVDTQDPVIRATLNGTPGDNNWFVSDTTLTVVFSDPIPGSGVAYNRALSNLAEISVVNPYTFTEGVYALQLDVRDFAGRTAQTLYTLQVDTTPPLVSANQPPVELVMDGVEGGGYMNGSVVFTGTCSDATSGVNRIEISTGSGPLTAITPNADGTWTLDWDSSMLSDGTYTPVITAVDNAGNRTNYTMQPISLDNSAPAMSMTGGWYIWDSGHIIVFDSRAGIRSIELSVRDDQGRWPAREWDFDTPRLEMDLQWDRKFGDGTIAPTGSYEVLLQAWDRLGNGRWITSRIYIPEAGATAVIPYGGIISAGDIDPTGTPLPTLSTGSTDAGAAGGSEPQPSSMPEPTRTMIAVPISGGSADTTILTSADNSADTAPANTTPLTDGILWGAAAVAAGAAAAVVSAKQLKETRAKVEAEMWEEAMDAIAKRWEQTVAGVVAWNKAVAEAEAKHQKEVDKDKAKWLELIAKTGGHAITDLSEEQFQDFINQSEGAYLAAKEYIDQQKAAYDAAKKQADLNLQSAVSYAAASGFIASQERAKAENELAAINNKLTRDEIEITQNMSSMTEDEQKRWDKFVQDESNFAISAEETLHEKKSFKEKLADLLNSSSAALGGFHDYYEKSILQKNNSNGNQLSQDVNYTLESGQIVVDTARVGAVNFTPLETGMVSVNAHNLPDGMRANYFRVVPNEFNLHPGGNYLPETINARVSRGLIEGATDAGAFATAGLVSGITNAIEYGQNANEGSTFWQRTVLNQEFWVSTAVDTVLSVAVGYAVTALVTAAIGAAVVPVLLPVLAIGVVSMGVGFGLNALGVPNIMKDGINYVIDKIQGEI